MSVRDGGERLSQLPEYLRRVGFKFNPFEKLEASADPRLLTYLVGHWAFDDAWREGDVVIHGPTGSGRTAVAERLVHECRVGLNSRRVFPLLLRADGVRDKGVGGALRESAASELLLEMFYRPDVFGQLDARARREAVAAMEVASPGMLDRLLPRIDRAESYLPAVQEFDPAGVSLPNTPSPESVTEAAEEMLRIKNDLSDKEILRASPLEAAVAASGADEVMVIADIDRGQTEAVMEGMRRARRKAPLKGKTVVKLLVSTEGSDKNEVLEIQKEAGDVLVSPLEWNPEQLVEVLQTRVKAASDGEFGSLDAISDRGVRQTEERIVSSLGNRSPEVTPRDAIAFANLLLQAGAESGNNLLTKKIFHQVKREFS